MALCWKQDKCLRKLFFLKGKGQTFPADNQSATVGIFIIALTNSAELRLSAASVLTAGEHSSACNDFCYCNTVLTEGC